MSDCDPNVGIKYLKANAFRIAIDRKNYPTAEFLANAVQHPSVTLTAPALAGRRITEVNFPGEAVSFDQLNITFIVDDQLKVYKEMMGWVERNTNERFISSEEAANETTESDIASETDISVTVLDGNNNPSGVFQYKSCSPTTIGPLAFTSAVATSDIITFDVTFSFTTFELRT